MGTLRRGRVSFAKVKSFPLREKAKRSLTDELKSFTFSFFETQSTVGGYCRNFSAGAEEICRYDTAFKELNILGSLGVAICGYSNG